MEEIWKDVPGCEGFYKVSNTGKVLSTIKNIIIRPHKNNGYERVELHKNGKFFKFFVHRLVAQAFIPNPDNKPVVDHINTIRDDNNVSNLRWVSVSENINNENTLKKHGKYDIFIFDFNYCFKFNFVAYSWWIMERIHTRK